MAGSSACKVYYFGPQNPVELGVAAENISWIPILEIKPLKENLEKILEGIIECDTIVFTSPRGPGILGEIARPKSGIVELLKRKRIVAIGGKTSNAIREYLGAEPCCMPDVWDSAGLGDLLCTIRPRCALLLRARQASHVLPEKLEGCGVNYRSVSLYELMPKPQLLSGMKFNDYPMIISSSLIARTIINTIGCPGNRVLVALGRTTFNTIRELCGDSSNVMLPDKPDLKKAVELALNRGCG